MKVTLVTHTPNPEQLIACAAKLCYSESDIDSILSGLTSEKSENFINMLSDLGHESPFEHVTFTFAAEGISRACSHQLVRHRIASFSQKSQRYVNESNFSYVTPDAIQKNYAANKIFISTMDQIQKNYDIIKQLLISDGIDTKAAQENARSILPNACETSLIFTMNVRSLYNFFKLRCCNRAQDEIRELAWLMLKECIKVSPVLFKNAGPACLKHGICPEGKMTCGKSNEVKLKYDEMRSGLDER